MITQYLEFTFLLFVATFIAFIVVAELKTEIEGRPKLAWLRTPFKVVFVVPFLFMDWVLNWLLTPFFWDIPDSFFELVTARMKRYKRVATGRRYKFACWLCNHLNRHDAGHC